MPKTAFFSQTKPSTTVLCKCLSDYSICACLSVKTKSHVNTIFLHCRFYNEKVFNSYQGLVAQLTINQANKPGSHGRKIVVGRDLGLKYQSGFDLTTYEGCLYPLQKKKGFFFFFYVSRLDTSTC